MLKDMLKKYKWSLLVSSVITVLPAVFGLIVWQRLPAQMPIHWGANGQVDGYAPRVVAVLLMPLLLLAVHWLCFVVTACDRRAREQSPRVFRPVLWIVPVLSVFVGGATYMVSLGVPLSIGMAVSLLAGVGFILLGNMLPKCRQNHSIGIKVKWTLEDKANWDATHRFGGRLWVVGGVVLLPAAFLPEVALPWVLLGVILLLAAAPTVYSYLYYKNHR